jgi:hypothetical protein
MLTTDFFVMNSYPFKAHHTAFASASFVETEFETASSFGGLTHCYTYCNLYEILTFGVPSNFLGSLPFQFQLLSHEYVRSARESFALGLALCVRLYSFFIIIKLAKIDDAYSCDGTELIFFYLYIFRQGGGALRRAIVRILYPMFSNNIHLTPSSAARPS